GYIVGLTSVGSGVFFGLTLLFVFPLRAHKVVGTDILHAAGLLWVAGFGHLIAGNVDTHALAWLLVGSRASSPAASSRSISATGRCGSCSPSCSSPRARSSSSRTATAGSPGRPASSSSPC